MPKTILLVEDFAPTRDALAGILRGEGFHVLSASDSEAALEHLRQASCPDVILFDERVGGADGGAVVDMRRRDPALESIPLIVLSNRASCSSWVRGKEITGTVDKPVPIERLLGLIRQAT